MLLFTNLFFLLLWFTTDAKRSAFTCTTTSTVGYCCDVSWLHTAAVMGLWRRHWQLSLRGRIGWGSWEVALLRAGSMLSMCACFRMILLARDCSSSNYRVKLRWRYWLALDWSSLSHLSWGPFVREAGCVFVWWQCILLVRKRLCMSEEGFFKIQFLILWTFPLCHNTFLTLGLTHVEEHKVGFVWKSNLNKSFSITYCDALEHFSSNFKKVRKLVFEKNEYIFKEKSFSHSNAYEPSLNIHSVSPIVFSSENNYLHKVS